MVRTVLRMIHLQIWSSPIFYSEIYATYMGFAKTTAGQGLASCWMSNVKTRVGWSFLVRELRISFMPIAKFKQTPSSVRSCPSLTIRCRFNKSLASFDKDGKGSMFSSQCRRMVGKEPSKTLVVRPSQITVLKLNKGISLPLCQSSIELQLVVIHAPHAQYRAISNCTESMFALHWDLRSWWEE